MADDPQPDPQPEADLFSRDDDGNKVDAWIFEELLGDDPVNKKYATDLDQPQEDTPP